eukprot:288643-Prorocentrum_lima.AAC.1
MGDSGRSSRDLVMGLAMAMVNSATAKATAIVKEKPLATTTSIPSKTHPKSNANNTSNSQHEING